MPAHHLFDHQIIDYGSHPGTVQYLVRLMNVPPTQRQHRHKPDGRLRRSGDIGRRLAYPLDSPARCRSAMCLIVLGQS